MKIHICIPTLKRYDLLDRLIQSLRTSIVLPFSIIVIDNGGGWFAPERDVAELHFTDTAGIYHHYYKFGGNIGLATSWNYFLQHVPEIRIICNDDLTFTPYALSALLDTYDENALISPDSIIGGNAYSCFAISDKLVKAVGLFDESISPQYAYFEDNDHFRRLTLAGYCIHAAHGCEVAHSVSSTLHAMSGEELEQHHRKFARARTNYISKWGGMPGSEKYTVPYNGET